LWSPTMYFQARQFLHRLENALSLLDQEDAPKFLLGYYQIQAKNVGELLRYMTLNGLRFAQASPGNETAYTALHRLMADYSRRAGSPLGDPRPKSGERGK
jgi:hypothetical protein